jgi:hypothetical protein
MKTLDLSKMILPDAVPYQTKITIQSKKELISIPLEVNGKSTQNRQGVFIAFVLQNETGKEVKAVSHKMEGKTQEGILRQVSANSDGSLIWVADLLTNGKKISVSVKESAGKKVFDLIRASGQVILANSVKVQEKKAEYQAEKGKVLNSL